VSKLKASNGSNITTITVGQQPQGIAFDGANIWVANLLDGNASKL
jgi:DNA-binding beta-propeller fold protein YncE